LGKEATARQLALFARGSGGYPLFRGRAKNKQLCFLNFHPLELKKQLLFACDEQDAAFCN
jgi:Holliday junction resolvase